MHRKLSQQQREQRHANINAVLCLAEIFCARVGVELGMNLLQPRQRVEQDQIRFGVLKRISIEPVAPVGPK